MKNNSMILLTKDAMCTEYLPCYGNQYWKGKTPNLDELAEKGTLFTRFYTAGGSSDMSYLAMFTRKYPYQLGIADYVPLESELNDNVFEHLYQKGYECHIVWDEGWMNDIPRCRCFGEHTTFHPIPSLRQKLGFRYAGMEKPIGEDVVQMAISSVDKTLSEISKTEKKVFLWMHLPHVINGRPSYGSDIDAFDQVIGMIRNYFSDDCITVSADHGNMNGHSNILGYGFYVQEPVARIPLITPRKQGLTICNDLVSNVDMEQILFEKEIPKRDHVFIDTAYYAQEHRILAIITDRYKYIYHKQNASEELFDLQWDPAERFNLISDTFHDEGRKADYPARELFFYDNWEALPTVRQYMRTIRNEMWQDKPTWWKVYKKIRHTGGKVLRFMRGRK